MNKFSIISIPFWRFERQNNFVLFPKHKTFLVCLSLYWNSRLTFRTWSRIEKRKKCLELLVLCWFLWCLYGGGTTVLYIPLQDCQARESFGGSICYKKGWEVFQNIHMRFADVTDLTSLRYQISFWFKHQPIRLTSSETSGMEPRFLQIQNNWDPSLQLVGLSHLM